MKTPFFVAALLAVALLFPSARGRAAGTFSVVEASISDMQLALRQRRVTSRELVEQSLQRIAMYEERLNAVMAVNPHAIEQAETLDRERRVGHIRGPLHGIPVALKDNIHTLDMPTTGGALAFAGFRPPYPATVTQQLQQAGAVIIAKTVMTELANWVAPSMPGGYSAVGGFGFNPYDPRRDPRPNADGSPFMPPGGSSSGSGTAASFWAANVGTETSGSILNPANATMLVGIKPTVGRVSRFGVIPITSDQDTPGPLARTVSDAAIMLTVLEAARPDPRDPATSACTPNGDYTRFLKASGLKGARIGIPRGFFYEPVSFAGERRGGMSEERRTAMMDAIAVLKANGATVVDPADIPSMVSADANDSLLAWATCSGESGAKGRDATCSTVFKYGMKRDFNQWLASLGSTAPVQTLRELRLWNSAHQAAGALKYGQAQLDISDEMDLTGDRDRYLADRAKDIRLSRNEGVDAALKSGNLDALMFPGATGAAVPAKAGYPSVTVPFTRLAQSTAVPDGFNPRPVPFGVTFTGPACSEARLIELAFAFEQATRRRVPPDLDSP